MSSSNRPEVVAICICTYRRPERLLQLLRSIEGQQFSEFARPELHIVVIDNDAAESAREVVTTVASTADLSLHYTCEPVKNISLARNAAIQAARGYSPDWLFFLDDDTLPDATAIEAYLRAVRQQPGRVYFGFHKLELPEGAPFWAKRLGMYNASRLVLSTATLWLRPDVFDEVGVFDAQFGLTGGEDSDFVVRCRQRAILFEFVLDAVIRELMPRERLTLRWHVRRYFRAGTTNAKIGCLRQRPSLWRRMGWVATHVAKIMLRAVFALGYLVVLQVSRALDQVLLMMAYVGFLCGLCGWVVEEYR